jgi:hypothetical protein
MHVMSRSCMATAFSWWWSLSSCFYANLWISLDTTSICRSLWRSLFLMYLPGCIDFVLELLYNVCITLFGATPEMDTVCPNGNIRSGKTKNRSSIPDREYLVFRQAVDPTSLLLNEIYGALSGSKTAETWSWFNLLKPTGYVIHQEFNIQQMYALPALYLCVLRLSQNKQQPVSLTA